MQDTTHLPDVNTISTRDDASGVVTETPKPRRRLRGRRLFSAADDGRVLDHIRNAIRVDDASGDSVLRLDMPFCVAVMSRLPLDDRGAVFSAVMDAADRFTSPDDRASLTDAEMALLAMFVHREDGADAEARAGDE